MVSDDPGEELRLLRERLDDLERLADRLEAADFTGGQSLAVKTTAIGTYPTSAAVTYAVVAEDVTGVTVEGGAGDLTDRGGKFLALNLGTARPPIGTALVVMLVPYAYVFRYDG